MTNLLKELESWRHEFLLAMMRGTPLDVERIMGPHACRLGRWLVGPGRRYADQPWYGQMLDEHLGFHREAGRLAVLLNRGRYAEVEAGLRPGAEYARRAQVLQELLRQHLEHLAEEPAQGRRSEDGALA